MIHWQYKKFNELNPAELYSILQLRNEVFVIEQNCIYQDADNKDQFSLHLMGMDKDSLVAYTRILPPGLAYREPSIGRVVTSASVRGTGIGVELMKRSIQTIKDLFGDVPIRIGAQLYLHDFYSLLGFRKSGEPYLEDGIEHIEMVSTGENS